MENKVLPGPMSNEVSFLGSSLYSALSSLDHFQQICLDHFLSHYGGGLQVLGMFVYSSYFKPAHFGSLDRYVSFLLAPATA